MNEINNDQLGSTPRRLTRRALIRSFAGVSLGLTGAALLGCSSDDEAATATATAAGGTATAAPTSGGSESMSLLDEARERGFVRIGFANEAPYGFANAAGEVTGEAPEVAKAVLAKLGIPEVDGVVTTFGSLIPGLQAGRFDMIAAGMFINPDRCQQILFSDPDYCVPSAFGVAAGNPKGLLNYEDVAKSSDATIGVLSGAVEEGYALDSGVPDDRVIRFDETTSLAEGLQAGRVDAMALTSLSVRAQLDRLSDDALEMTPGFVPVINGEEQVGCGGYGFRQEDQAFRDAFNDVLVQMKQGGEVLPIVQPFGFFEDEVGAATDRTVEDLCG